MVNSTLARDLNTNKVEVELSNDAASLIALRDSRLRMTDETSWTANTTTDFLPADLGDLFPRHRNKIPEIRAEDLEIGLLASAMRHHGALIIRGLLEKSQAGSIRTMMDKAMEVAEKVAGDKKSDSQSAMNDNAAWFYDGPALIAKRGQMHKSFLASTGSLELLRSPKVSAHVLEIFESLGLRSLFASYFGDESCVSLKKSVMRRVEPLLSPPDWHQDGAFMSGSIKSLNLWVALTKCGEQQLAPGIDLIPKRLFDVLDPGTDGANFTWSLSNQTVRSTFEDVGPITPVFNEGDAIIFDHLNLHATSFGAHYTDTRYALETWFFANQHAPENQIPVYW